MFRDRLLLVPSWIFFFFNQKFQARDREISCEKSEMSCESHWESVWWIETSDDPLVHWITAFRHFVFESRVQKSGTGNDKFVKWKGKIRFNRSDRSKWTTFKAGPQYSGRTRPKWSVPFDVPTEITGILGWMESAPSHSLWKGLFFPQTESLFTGYPSQYFPWSSEFISAGAYHSRLRHK